MSGRNIEVRLGVFDAEGIEIQDAVVAAAGEELPTYPLLFDSFVK